MLTFCGPQRLPSPQCASAIHIVRRREFTAGTQPQRDPGSATVAEANFCNIDSVFHKINLFMTRAGRLT
jgi:hypothetical protein